MKTLILNITGEFKKALIMLDFNNFGPIEYKIHASDDHPTEPKYLDYWGTRVKNVTVTDQLFLLGTDGEPYYFDWDSIEHIAIFSITEDIKITPRQQNTKA